MSALVIRQAEPADAPALVDLIESAYRGDRSRSGWTTEADLLDGQRVDLPMVEQMRVIGRNVCLAPACLVGLESFPPSLNADAFFG
ncbi:hypothetical protein [Brevibacterium ravenspurgense]|uniref:hypothetical protein n=1 Tax=Brevibacterium ravenspurgense TaxID=479117 RepID=UPI000778236F